MSFSVYPRNKWVLQIIPVLVCATALMAGCPPKPPVTPAPDLLAVPVSAAFADPADPNDAGWADAAVPVLAVETSGNPLLGGHGATGNNPNLKQLGTFAMNIQAAYSADMLYMRFLWNDATRNDTTRHYTYSEATGTWSTIGQDEDRLYVMWPIQDGTGRVGKTFDQAGCAMTCHGRSASNGSTLATINDSVRLDDCSACHDSPGNVAGRVPPFEHPAATQCAGCHSADYASVSTPATALRDATNGGDMIAPVGTAFDVWHWKAQRSNPIGVAEDQYTANAVRRSRDGANLAPDNVRAGGGGPRYIWADGGDELRHILQSQINANTAGLAEWNADSMQYEDLANGAPVVLEDGQQALSNILRDDLLATDASANTLARGDHDGDTWAVVISRSLVSTDPEKDVNGMMVKTDFDFDTDKRALFSVAYTDNSGAVHHGVAGPLELGFQK